MLCNFFLPPSHAFRCLPNKQEHFQLPAMGKHLISDAQYYSLDLKGRWSPYLLDIFGQLVSSLVVDMSLFDWKEHRN